MVVEDNLLKGNIFCIANVDAKKVLASLEDDHDVASKECRKRKRLEDFTPQEKMIRRKLKNRVAAQTARDRKKERLEQLEKIVTRLETENKELKESNKQMQINMTELFEQNKIMRRKLGMGEELKSGKDIIITPAVMDHDHIVIKKEEDTVPEYASLGISLPQKVQILLVSLITMWLANPRLENCLTSLSNSEQEVFVKSMLQKKLISQKKLNVTRLISIERIMKMNLIPIIQTCIQQRKKSYSHSVKTSKILWMDPMIM